MELYRDIQIEIEIGSDKYKNRYKNRDGNHEIRYIQTISKENMKDRC